MTETFTVDIVTPQEQLLSTSVNMAVIPGAEGVFGVLAHHAPTLAKMKAGVISLYEGDNLSSQIAVFGGVAEVTDERCTILATHASIVKDDTKTSLESKLSDDNVSDDDKSDIQAILSDLN